MKTRRIGAAVFAVAITTATLAACSPASTGGGAPESDAISGEVTVLTPLFASDSSRQALEASLQGFYEEYPDVTVTFDYTDYGKLNEKITTGVASGLLPDVVQVGIGWIPPLADKGILAPLDEYGFTADSLAEDFPAPALSPGQYEGQTYAVPFVSQGTQGVYRKDYFEEAGLDPEDPPSTWDELREAAIATTVRADDGTLERAGFTAITDNLRANFSTFLFANGGQQFRDDNSGAAFNSPEGVEALEFLDELVNTDKVVDVGFDSGAPQHPILSGKAAIALYNNYIDCENPDVVTPEICEQLGYFAVPGNEEGESAVYLGGTLTGITEGAKNPDAAAALVRYFAQEPEVAFATAAAVFSVPSQEAAWSDPRVAETPSAEYFLSVIDSAGYEGGPVTWLDTRNDFIPALESVVLGGEEAQTALDALAEKADSAIAAAQ